MRILNGSVAMDSSQMRSNSGVHCCSLACQLFKENLFRVGKYWISMDCVLFVVVS